MRKIFEHATEFFLKKKKAEKENMKEIDIKICLKETKRNYNNTEKINQTGEKCYYKNLILLYIA